MKKKLRFVIVLLIIIALCAAAVAGGINGWVVGRAEPYLLTPEQAQQLGDADCILVLGCYVYNNGNPSAMLEDRLRRGVELYEAGVSEKLLMSGDHGTKGYDEVGTMKAYATEREIPSQNVFMDHAGFSTYESMYRAAEVFEADKIVIVTQKYHLYRAVYAARALGLDAYGVAADYRSYSGQIMRDIREVLARCKDFAICILQPEPTFLGDVIPVSGNGDVTNDSLA